MFWIFLIVINAAAFLLMRADKRAAQNRRFRIPESVLLFFAAIGGSLGAMIGMVLLRHKTRHLRFSIGIPVLFFLHTGLVLLFVI